MNQVKLPKYPIYVPSKGRFDHCQTAEFLIKDKVPFYLVVEPQEVEHYSKFGEEKLLVLPWSNLGRPGLIAARNWIKEHSISQGYFRHWQLDDNIKEIAKWEKGKRKSFNSGIALRETEDFVDRYENIAIAGLNYRGFTGGAQRPPFYLNVHVYSCCLILNAIGNRWRTEYNEDTDLCLQVLSEGWCTVLINVFCIDKAVTMTVKGGNTPYYQKDGRLIMSRSLERLWPNVVETRRRYRRPQHFIRYAWKKFDTPLKLKQ